MNLSVKVEYVDRNNLLLCAEFGRLLASVGYCLYLDQVVTMVNRDHPAFVAFKGGSHVAIHSRDMAGNVFDKFNKAVDHRWALITS